MKRASKQSAVLLIHCGSGKTGNRFYKSKYSQWHGLHVHRAIYGPDMAKHTRGACVRVKTRYFEKMKINISTLSRIQTKLST